MKIVHLKVALLLCFIVILNACKKADKFEKVITSNFDETQFFKGSENVDGTTNRLVAFFKNKQMKNPNFLPNITQKCGYPVWNKTITKLSNNITGRTTTEGTQDTVIQLPFVVQNTSLVNAFVEAIVSDTIGVELYESYKYKELSKGAINASTLTAEKYINEFFMLQNKVFNHKSFKILDSSLFKSFIPINVVTNAKVKFINISEDSTNGTVTNSFGEDGCIHYTTHYTTSGGTDALPTVIWHTVHHKVCLIGNFSALTLIGAPAVAISTISSFDLGSGGIPGFTGGTSYTGNPVNNNPVYSGPNTNNFDYFTTAYVDSEDLFASFYQLISLLPNLTGDEKGFLLDHPKQMKEIVNYLNANNTQEAKDKVLLHITKMKSDTDYLALVLSHSLGSVNVTVWWDDYFWYSSPNNEDILNPTDKLFWLMEFPINVPEPPVIDNGISIEEADPNIPPVPTGNIQIAATIPRGNTEDLTFGTNGDDSGIEPAYLSLSTESLFNNMRDLMAIFTWWDSDLKDAASRFRQIFKTNLNNSAEVSDIVVESKVKESTVFKNFISRFGLDLNRKLKATNGSLTNVNSFILPYRPVFNSLHDKFHGLQILMNDTEFTKIDINNYTCDSDGNWKANLTVVIYDHFGMDKNDVLTNAAYHSGFSAWWILQHKKAKVPFITKATIKLKISGNYSFVF